MIDEDDKKAIFNVLCMGFTHYKKSMDAGINIDNAHEYVPTSDEIEFLIENDTLLNAFVMASATMIFDIIDKADNRPNERLKMSLN